MTDAASTASPSGGDAPFASGQSDAALLERFCNAKKPGASSKTLGAEALRIDQAAMEVEFAFEGRAEFCNPVGQIQGGFLSAMLDEVMSVAGVVTSGVTASIASLEIKTTYLRPAVPGRLRGVGRVVKWGRTICFLEGELYDAEGRAVARASSSAMPVPFKKREG